MSYLTQVRKNGRWTLMLRSHTSPVAFISVCAGLSKNRSNVRVRERIHNQWTTIAEWSNGVRQHARLPRRMK